MSLRAARGLACAVALTVSISACPAADHVAVFNFEMQQGPAQWGWLAKGLADRLTIDLFSDPGLCVVDRDAMQRVADRVRWAPEMMRDRRRLRTVRASLRSDYLISGMYSVREGRLSITAVVIDFSNYAEAARRTVTGPATEALELMRRLSAELMAWLSFGKAEKILKSLPVWTRSIPAARALYEGMDLYDQGRYGEAWLKFRNASRQDPGYVEATYWVGKMYYFMD
ncbi:MAG: hypothetical protein ACYS5V_02875, partial [Planctomycetota bacterium]